MRIQALILVVGLWLTTSFAQAETITYHLEDQPLFSITFPDDWYTDIDFADEAEAASVADSEIRILEAMPSDGTKLWFGIWVAPRVDSIDRGLDYLESLDTELFSQIDASEPRETELGGMRAMTFYGTAVRQEEDVEFAVALFQLRPEVIVVALYVGRPDTWNRHEEALAAIVESLSPARR